MKMNLLLAAALLTLNTLVVNADDITVTTSADGLTETRTSADTTHGWANYKPQTTTITTSPDGNTRSYDSTDYTHGWANSTPDITTFHYSQERPMAIAPVYQDSPAYSAPAPSYSYAPPYSRRDGTPAAAAPTPAPTPTAEMKLERARLVSLSTKVLVKITSNRWKTVTPAYNGDTGTDLIVSGTLTNTNAVAVRVTNMSAAGFDTSNRLVVDGQSSSYTIFKNSLAPGESVNFKEELPDGAKTLRFVKVSPSVTD
jgi:hypothetical protein